MRRFAMMLLLCPAAGMSTAAIAQTAPSRTADDIVCQYVDCSANKAPQAGEESREVGDLKGFSMAVRKSGDKKDVAAPARSPTVASAPVRPAPRNIGRASSPVQQVASARSTATPSAIHGRKADMRVSFLKNSAELTEQAKAEARVFAQAMQRPELAKSRFRIEGHTDTSGSRALNLDLSARRAAAVADFLSNLGVSRSRLDTKGYGPDHPLPGKSAASPDNRRVEAVLL